MNNAEQKIKTHISDQDWHRRFGEYRSLCNVHLHWRRVAYSPKVATCSKCVKLWAAGVRTVQVPGVR